MVPVLFVAGVVFGYFVALPRAVDFLQNFNDDAFDILVQARDYYRFVVVLLALMGLVFQVPVGVLALTRTGVVNARASWKNQGYVILGIAVARRRRHAHARPRDDARHDGAADPPLRDQHRPRLDLPPARGHHHEPLGRLVGRRGRRPRRRRARRSLTPRTRPPAYPDRMLFDLRGKGRRRTVQVIYLSLAILMGGGLVLFGIGGATSGGLFDAFSSDSGTQNVSSTYEKQVKANQKPRSQANPKDAAAWAALTRAQVQQAGVTGYDDATGTYTADGLKQLQTAGDLVGEVPRPRPEEARRQPRVAHGQHLRRQRAQRPREALRRRRSRSSSTNAAAAPRSTRSSRSSTTPPATCARASSPRRTPSRLADPDQRKLVKARIAAQRKQIDKAKLQGAVQQGRPPHRAPAAEHPAAPSGYHHTSARPDPVGRAGPPL